MKIAFPAWINQDTISVMNQYFFILAKNKLIYMCDNSTIDFSYPNEFSNNNVKMETQSQTLASIKHLKIGAFREFMKRLYFEYKYVNLTKICEEYLDELIENLNVIIKKQQDLLNNFIIKNNAKNYLNSSSDLCVISELSQEDSCDNSITTKINQIQDKLIDIEEINQTLYEKYGLELTSLRNQIDDLNYQKETNKKSLINSKKIMNDLNFYDQHFISIEYQKENTKDLEWYTSNSTCNNNNNKDKSIQKFIKESNDKFDRMQKNHSNFQKYDKNIPVNTSPIDMDNCYNRKINSENSFTNNDGPLIIKSMTKDTVSELKKRLQKSEKNIRDHENTILELQKQISTLQSQITTIQKENNIAISDKKVSESRIKNLQHTIKSLEKQKEKLSNSIQKKDQTISKLEEELGKMNESSKANPINKIDSLNNSVSKESAGYVAKSKDQEIEYLRATKVELESECKKLVNALLERELEITNMKSKIFDLKEMIKPIDTSIAKVLKDRAEENWSSSIYCTEEKDNEATEFRKTTSQKELDSTEHSSCDYKKTVDLEIVIMNQTKELIEKEVEIKDLKRQLELYKHTHNVQLQVWKQHNDLVNNIDVIVVQLIIYLSFISDHKINICSITSQLIQERNSMGGIPYGSNCCRSGTNDSKTEFTVSKNKLFLKKSLSFELKLRLHPILLFEPDITMLQIIDPMEVPYGITLDYVKNPHQIQKIHSVSFLTEFIHAVQSTKLVLFSNGMQKEFESLNNKMEEAHIQCDELRRRSLNGLLKPLQYRQALTDDITRDEKLLHFYSMKKSINHYEYMNIRIDCTKRDLAEFDIKMEYDRQNGITYTSQIITNFRECNMKMNYNKEREIYLAYAYII